MAIVKYAPLIAEARGAVGDVVFSRNTYGAYVRDRVTPANPDTSYQQYRRGLLASCVSSWQSLSDAQRKEWCAYASFAIQKNIFGDDSRLTGYNLYIKLNYWRIRFASGAFTSPPDYVAPYHIRPVSFSCDNSSVDYTITWDVAPTSANRLIIYATPELSPGINYPYPHFRYLTNNTSGTSKNIYGNFSSRFGGPATAGKKIFLYLFTLHTASGIVSSHAGIHAIVVP